MHVADKTPARTLDVAVPHALGHAVVELDNGKRVVTHADPSIWVSVELLDQLRDDEMLTGGGGVDPLILTLDTAGTCRYRAARPDEGLNAVVFVRIEGPDDPTSEHYQRGKRRESRRGR
jgi:hypothetical protein